MEKTWARERPRADGHGTFMACPFPQETVACELVWCSPSPGLVIAMFCHWGAAESHSLAHCFPNTVSGPICGAQKHFYWSPCVLLAFCF